MTYRKTWFSYVLWAEFAAICAMLFTFLGVCLAPDSVNDGIAAVVMLFFCAAAVTAGYFVLRSLALAVRKKYVMSAHAASMWECFAVGILFAGTIIGQFRIASDFQAWLSGKESFLSSYGLIDSRYFDEALVKAESTALSMTHGIDYLYVLCLSFVLSFLGNRIFSAILFEMFLKVLALALCYAIARKLAGRLPACVALTVLSLLSQTGYRLSGGDGGSYAVYLVGDELTPSYFWLVLYLIGMFGIVNFVKSYCNGILSRGGIFVMSVAAGALAGVLVYFDFFAVTLLLLLVGLLIGEKGKQKEHKRVGLRMKTGVFFLTLISAAAVWFSLFFIDGYVEGGDGWTKLEEWISFHLSFENFDLLSSFALFSIWKYLVVAVVAFAAFLVIDFMKRKGAERRNDTLWLLLCLVTAPTPFAGGGVTPCYLYAFFIWSVLAGLGLQNCLFGEKAKVVRAVIEKINEESLIEQESKPRYIENPLPLPRKHVKREMDYQYEVADDKMKYDVEVDGNDDFDIR